MNNLTPRITNARPANNIEDVELNELKTEIISHIAEIKNMTQLVSLFDTTNPDDIIMKEFILRAQIVWICASLDYYLHRIQSLGLFKIYEGIISPQNNDVSIKIPFQVVIELSKNNKSTFVDDVYDSLKDYSYIGYRQLEDILKQFGIKIVDIAKQIYSTANKPKKLFDAKFKEICDRRHLIAHKMDINPNGQKEPINETIVNEYINFIEQLILEFHKKIENLI